MGIMTIADSFDNVDAFIFDFYGTLVGDHWKIPSKTEVLTKLGYNTSSLYESIFEADGYDGQQTPRLGEGHEEWRTECLRKLALFSGVDEGSLAHVTSLLYYIENYYYPRVFNCSVKLLQLLRSRGYRIGICSNWETDLSVLLDQVGLSEMVDSTVFSARVGFRKPNPVMFDTICSSLSVKPSRTVFVGDNWNSDVKGAIQSGLIPVWLRNGSVPQFAEVVCQFSDIEEFYEVCQKALAE